MTSDQTLFEPFEKEGLPDMIVNRLLTLIKEKRLQPGDKLPPERELAAMMGVGRPSLRSALRALAVMHVIDIRPGSGAYISSLQVDKLVEHLDFVFSLDESSILQLFDARTTVEVRTAVLAARHATDDDIVRIKDYLDQIETLVRDNTIPPADELEPIDRAFHNAIAEASQNFILARFVRSITQLAADYRRQSMQLPGAMDRTIVEHRAIILAIENHDETAAQEAMLQHLSQAKDNLRQLQQDGVNLN